MNYLRWCLPCLIVLVLIMTAITGCGVAQSEYDALQAQKQTLENDLNSLQSEYDALNDELLAIKEVYPPREFSSRTEIEDWLYENDVSERPISDWADTTYIKALEIQSDALSDGYIVSVDYDYDLDEEMYYIYCTTIIDGYVWYWEPETDEIYVDSNFGKIK